MNTYPEPDRLVRILAVERGRHDIISLEVGVLRENLLRGLAGSQELEHIDDSDTPASDAGRPPHCSGSSLQRRPARACREDIARQDPDHDADR
jgi:hypothetical protein